MMKLRVIKLAVFTVLVCSGSMLYAKDNLLIYVFRDGLVQANITVSVDGIDALTSTFGKAGFELKPNKYKVSYFKNGEKFAVTDVDIIGDIQSQVFLNLTADGANASLDMPLSALKKQFEKKNTKKLKEGPRGKLVVTALEQGSGTPIANARLFFKGYDVEANTNEQGIAEIELPEDAYDFSLVHPQYVMAVKKGIEIKAEETISQSLELSKSDFVMDEYVVSAPFVEGGLASTISTLKEADVIGDAISSEQFTKSGDSTASDALKRVTGITVVDGKFIYIRGLGERYSTILLNDMHVPSPEPTKRVVPLDIFPTGVIQNMDIQKTWSAELPGTFAGGTVLIKSKDIPKEDNYITGSISIDIPEDLGKEVLVGNGNSKGMPALIIGHSENFGALTEEVIIGSTVIAEGLTTAEKDELNRAMVNYRDYGPSKKKIELGKKLSLSAGQSFKTSAGLKYGFAGSIYYKTGDDLLSLEKNEYQHNQTTGEDLHKETGTFEVVTLKEKLGGLISFGIDDLNAHSGKYTLLLLDETSDTTNFGTRDKLIEDTHHERTFLQYVEQDMLTHQFNGTSKFGEALDWYFDEIVLDWGLEMAEANRLEPGTFEYEYKEESIGEVLDAKKLFYLYSDLHDEVDNQRIDITLPFKFNKQKNYTKFGLFNYSKNRNLDNRRFKIKYDNSLDTSDIDTALSETNVSNGDIDVLDAYKPDDFYTAEQEVTALYAKQLLSPRENLDVTLGLRLEDSTQNLSVGAEKETHSLATSEVLPSLGATYRFNDAHQLRLWYADSISRPDFREFSPNRFKDPLTGYIVFGFADLKQTKINNFDFKYEWYPSYNEFVSLGLFAKTFTNPIETVRTISDVDIETSFRNAKSAESLGLELGFRKNLGGQNSRLQNFFVEGNLATIDSSISLDKNAPKNENDQFIPFLTSDNRPMQGQSPYVFNISLGYDNLNTRRSAVLLYNEFGERITALGINGNPDIYEQPFRKLDFVLKWGLNDTFDVQKKKIGYTVSFKAENLLGNEIIETQGGKQTLRSQPGRNFNLSFSAKF